MIRRVSKGGLTHLLFFLSTNVSLEFYAKFEGQRFLETDRLNTWDQLHAIRRISYCGLTHLLFFLSTNILMEFYAIGDGQRFLETGDVSRDGTNSM